jgi:hypothetical protein
LLKIHFFLLDLCYKAGLFILPLIFCRARRLLQIKNPSLQQILVTGTEYLRGSTLLDHKNVTRLNGYLISLKAAFFRRLPAYTVPARFGGGILGLVIATHYYM